MKVSEVVSVAIGLSVTPASQAGFTVPILMVDHADVPVDRRYRQVTRPSYATDLTAATEQVGWCGALWGQEYNPAQAYIGRWVGTATSPQFICSTANATVATWKLIADGSCTVTAAAGADILTELDFTPVTSLADVAVVFNLKLIAGGVSKATCFVDALDRIVLTDLTITGAGSETVVITASGAGTDVTNATYLDIANGFAQGGLAVESLDTSLGEVLALDNTPYLVTQRGGSIVDVVAFATAASSRPKFLMLVDDDADAKDSAATSDFGYQIEALGYNKCQMCYTEHTVNNGAAATQYPDAAAIGQILTQPDKEGGISLALNKMTGLSESGLAADNVTVKPLTTTEITALKAKGYDFLVDPAGQVHLTTGLCAGGNEARVMIGKEFMGTKISEGIYAYLLANDVVTYSDGDLLAIKSIVSYWANELAKRGLLDSTTFDFSNFPTASDFTAAAKATHTMTLSDIFSADVFSSVNDVVMTLSFSV